MHRSDTYPSPLEFTACLHSTLRHRDSRQSGTCVDHSPLILFLHAKHSPTARSMKTWRRASTVLKHGRCTHSTLKSPTKVPLTGMEIKKIYDDDEAFYQGLSKDLLLTSLHRWHRIFLVDLLNFSFWSERDPDDKSVPHPARYAVEYQGVKYTGYWALCACINRGKCWHAFRCLNIFVFITYKFGSFWFASLLACQEGYPILKPEWWAKEASNDVLMHIFRSDTEEHMPMVKERIRVMREDGGALLKASIMQQVEWVHSPV
jgi:hypothetical protein